MIKTLIGFVIFAGVVYYYDIDVMKLVERSGAPQWLQEHGYVTKHVDKAASSTPEAASSTAR